jgi:hypothetical protein
MRLLHKTTNLPEVNILAAVTHPADMPEGYAKMTESAGNKQ